MKEVLECGNALQRALSEPVQRCGADCCLISRAGPFTVAPSAARVGPWFFFHLGKIAYGKHCLAGFTSVLLFKKNCP